MGSRGSEGTAPGEDAQPLPCLRACVGWNTLRGPGSSSVPRRTRLMCSLLDVAKRVPGDGDWARRARLGSGVTCETETVF